MAFDYISGLPEWQEDVDFREDDEEGEERKPKPTTAACKAMYEQ